MSLCRGYPVIMVRDDGGTMAATTGTRRKSSSSRANNKNSSRSSAGRPTKRKPASASRRQGQASGARSPTSPGGAAEGKVAAVRDDIQQSARDAGQTASKAVKKASASAKTPILVGGTAVASAAGGLALGARLNRSRKVLGVGMPRDGVHVKPRDFMSTARQVGRLTETAGHIAAELRRATEESNGKPRLSPIEVLLRGLTTRR
jgi:hypothetical protein